MSGIIDPRTGKPTGKKLTDEDVVNTLTMLKLKVDHVNMMNLQLSLYVEFLLEHFMQLTDANGDPLLIIDNAKFPDFAEERFKEIKLEAEKYQADMAAQGKSPADTIASMMNGNEELGINLNE